MSVDLFQAQRGGRRHALAAEPIGLLAGSGRFPILFAEAAQRLGLKVACVGIRDEANEAVLRPLCSSFDMVPVTKLGALIRGFQKRNVKRLVMAGKVHKSVAFDARRPLRLMPDWRMVRFWTRRLRDHKDDSILLGLIAEFERDGLVFDSALDYCPELLVAHGNLTRRSPSSSERRDIQFGWELAKEMGRLDVGQSVAVKDQAALAVEAIEGTDRCIERAGQYCRSGGWTLVKVAKPQQDMRFDVPTVGIDTIENLHRAGARVLAIESGMTIVVDQPDVVRLADRYGIAIVALSSADVEN